MKIPFTEFQATVGKLAAPDSGKQVMPTAPYVHVFDMNWLRDEFWPVWDEIRHAYKYAQGNQKSVLENSVKRGNCDEITKRFVSYLIESVRELYDQEDVGTGAFETSVELFGPDFTGVTLNKVSGPGGHRTVIVAGKISETAWQPIFVEPQLTYSQYEETTVCDAIDRGIVIRDYFV
jgi:hypothetical protein